MALCAFPNPCVGIHYEQTLEITRAIDQGANLTYGVDGKGQAGKGDL